MNLFQEYAYTQYLVAKMTGIIITAILLIGMGTLALDLITVQRTWNTEAVVIERMRAPVTHPGESTYMIAVSNSGNVWTARVNKQYFGSIQENDRILLGRDIGGVWGIIYQYYINDSIALQKASTIQ